ncbi:unnamed protein product [Phaeothamnion confervicola]
MRATAYLQRAYGHRRALTALLSRVAKDVPDTSTLQTIAKLPHPRMVIVLLDRLASYCAEKESLYQTTKFRYGLYEFALLRACDDALRATQLLPNYAKCWLRAGESICLPRHAVVAVDLRFIFAFLVSSAPCSELGAAWPCLASARCTGLWECKRRLLHTSGNRWPTS